MLAHLRQRLAELLAEVESVTLATSGEAGTLASTVPAAGSDRCLYLLLLSTSDHLFNIEQNPFVAVSTAGWELQGRARILPAAERPPGSALRERAALWGTVVEVAPRRLQVRAAEGWGYCETLDVEGEPEERSSRKHNEET